MAKWNPETQQMEESTDMIIPGVKFNSDIVNKPVNSLPATPDSAVPVNSPASGLGYNMYTPNQAEMNGLAASYNNLGGATGTGMDFNTWKGSMNIGNTDKGVMGNTMDFLGSDSMKGIGTIGGLAMSGLGIWNTMNAQDQAKKQWAAENDRANKVMAMNTERYNQWKTDKNRLNSEYA